MFSFFTNKSDTEEQVAALHRQATQLKGKDIGAEIECLRQARNLMRKSGAFWDAGSSVRLPLYLQQAGRFDEAMSEFQALLDGVDERIRGAFSHLTEKAQKALAHAERGVIYDKMRVACTRQKMTEKAGPAFFRVRLSA
jgi:tetratricopeptide (TPR) repeat protein